MSRRPPLRPGRAARMAPGGRMWSESPVRQAYPRVRRVGVTPPACGPDFPRVTFGATSAGFTCTEPFSYVGLSIRVTYTSSGACSARVSSVTTTGVVDWAPPATLYTLPAAPDGDGFYEFWVTPPGVRNLLAWTIEWSSHPGIVLDMCSIPVSNE